MHFLVIDDNELHCDLLEIFAEELGHTAEMYPSLDAVKKATFDKHFDAIFIDYHLDENANGIDVLHYLQQTLSNSHRYIALTADMGDKQKLLSSGFNAILFKPLSKIMFDDFLRGILT